MRDKAKTHNALTASVLLVLALAWLPVGTVVGDPTRATATEPTGVTDGDGAAVPLDSASPSGAIFAETFETGAAGWGRTGLWNLADCRSLTPVTSLAYNDAAARSNCRTNFHTGAAVSGFAQTPPIVLAPGEAELTWDVWFDTETNSFYDRKLVQVSFNGGAWNTLHHETGPAQTWLPRAVDLSAYTGGSLSIRFYFDSVDGAFNEGEGWYVDNIRVVAASAAGSVVVFSEDLDDGVADGWTLGAASLHQPGWHVSDCRSLSPPRSLAYNKVGCHRNFDTGAANSGDATSPCITVPPGSGALSIQWGSWHKTEFGTTYDKKQVFIGPCGSTTELIWTEDGTQEVWNARQVLKTGYLHSTLQLRFHFDTVDGIANGGEGWYVDDVVVIDIDS